MRPQHLAVVLALHVEEARAVWGHTRVHHKPLVTLDPVAPVRELHRLCRQRVRRHDARKRRNRVGAAEHRLARRFELAGRRARAHARHRLGVVRRVEAVPLAALQPRRLSDLDVREAERIAVDVGGEREAARHALARHVVRRVPAVVPAPRGEELWVQTRGLPGNRGAIALQTRHGDVLARGSRSVGNKALGVGGDEVEGGQAEPCALQRHAEVVSRDDERVLVPAVHVPRRLALAVHTRGANAALLALDANPLLAADERVALVPALLRVNHARKLRHLPQPTAHQCAIHRDLELRELTVELTVGAALC
mmetsp:Transcript_4202/g.9963  ORF Transcript_4202/g.9963 Transcript_4202/m.9963 type:complete len:309 (-) Transcript_4202:375-1301(-)